MDHEQAAARAEALRAEVRFFYDLQRLRIATKNRIIRDLERSYVWLASKGHYGSLGYLMGLDLVKFQAIFVEATEVYVNEVNQQACLAAVAAHDPKKLKDVLPKPQNTHPEDDSKGGLQDFIRDVGSF